MTGMLGSVKDAAEAEILIEQGADIIDIKEPSHGALGAVPVERAAAIVNVIQGRCLCSATIGDLPMECSPLDAAIHRMHQSGVDIIKVGVFSQAISPAILSMLSSHTERGVPIVLVFFADKPRDPVPFKALAEAGIYGVMLDTSQKKSGSLCKIMATGAIREFIDNSRAQGLICGLAGSLQAEDIPDLLVLKPDYLGFRSALCRGRERVSVIDNEAVRQIRTLIPVDLHYDEKRSMAY